MNNLCIFHFPSFFSFFVRYLNRISFQFSFTRFINWPSRCNYKLWIGVHVSRISSILMKFERKVRMKQMNRPHGQKQLSYDVAEHASKCHKFWMSTKYWPCCRRRTCDIRSEAHHTVLMCLLYVYLSIRYNQNSIESNRIINSEMSMSRPYSAHVFARLNDKCDDDVSALLIPFSMYRTLTQFFSVPHEYSIYNFNRQNYESHASTCNCRTNKRTRGQLKEPSLYFQHELG